jgi:hypothetical protein
MKKRKITNLVLLFSLPGVFSLTLASYQLGLHNLSNLAIPAQEQGYTGVFIEPSNNSDSAKYSATGAAGNSATGSVVEEKILLTSSTSQNKITAYGWSYGGDINKQGFFHFPAGSGLTKTNNLLIGCSAYLKSNVTSGNYSGIAHFRVTLNNQTITVPFKVTMPILSTNSVENQRPMTFPMQMAGFTGTYVLNPNANGAALFSASGNAGANAVAEVIPNTVTLTNPQNSGRIKVFGFNFSGYNGQINRQTGQFSFPSGLGQTIAHDILIGASAYYQPKLTTGVYSGTATLRITYR